jgi:heat-inducible transcriptional repressor
MAEVTQRQRAILMAIVQRYIESGEPVGSGTIAASVGASVSPATVRNEMAALGEAGLLEQPHTSAGRVPTARAFRLFVDGLGFAGARLSAQSRQEIDARFADVAGTNAVLERTSHVLASLSSGVGVAIATMPGGDQLEHVHFSRLAPARILAVVVTRGGVVRDRVLALDQDLSLTELGTAANFLNENFRGWEIERIRAELRLRVESEQREYQRLMNSIEQLWTKAVPHVENMQTAYVEGVANLVGTHPMGGADDRERLREMMSALETKQRLVNLLNAYIDARQESVRVVFDLEEQAPEMAGLVLIATRARLGSEGELLGTVGVIGPKRMQYERTMHAVGYVAKILERQGLGL